MRHTRAILLCALALSAGACAQSPTTPAPGAALTSPAAASYGSGGNFFGGGRTADTGTTSTASDTTTVDGRGGFLGGGH